MARTIVPAEKLRQQSLAELELRLQEAKREHFNLRVKATTKELVNPNEITQKRREIARLNTILSEKRNAGSR